MLSFFFQKQLVYDSKFKTTLFRHRAQIETQNVQVNTVLHLQNL